MTENTVITYVPETKITVEIDALAKAAFETWHNNWLAKQGAAAAKAAESKKLIDAEIAKLQADYDKLASAIETENETFASQKMWSKIAENETKLAAALKEFNKAVAKAKGHPVKNVEPGTMTVDKLDWNDIRATVFQFAFDNKTFVVAHSSLVSGSALGKIKAAADVFVAWQAEPVEWVTNDNGSKTCKGQPVITGKAMALEVKPGTGKGTLSHSGFCNGIFKALRANGSLTGYSDSTAFQPWKKESAIPSAYPWQVVKEG